MTTTADEPGHGRYDVLAAIGDGPRGPVFAVRRRGDVTADPWYELELSAFATGEDELQRRFVRDLERAARLRHRNLLGIIDLGTSPDGPFVVTEHIEGCTLSEIQDRQRTIRPPRLVLAAVIDALYGLHAAHALRIDGAAQPLIHGSLAPDHLRLGLDGTCRMSGFGNARPRVQTRASHRTRSAAGYMAPEQLTGGEIGRRSDLFAMGVVLWNALTGKQLFHDRIEHMTMSNVLERKVPRPSTIGLSPPPALDTAVMKALERDPARRYQTAAEMAAALHDAARDAGCLAAGGELGEWIAGSFGNELTVRRRMLRDLAERRATGAEPSALPVLPRLTAPATAEPDGRDELSLEELGRATGALPRAAAPALSPIAGAGPAAPTRRQLAIVALAAFAVVGGVLVWRALQAPSGDELAALAPAAEAQASIPPSPVELEVTVLDVRDVAASDPDPAAATPAEDAAAPAPTAMAIPPGAASGPARAPLRAKRADPPPRTPPPPRAAPRPDPPPRPAARPEPAPHPAEPRAEPADTRPAEIRPEPAPAKPEAPPHPPLESNPYLQK